MRPFLLASMTALLLLSGCASPAADEPAAQSATATTTVTTVVGQRAEPVFTDTLHVLDTPTVTVEAPDSYNDLRVPVRSFNEAATALTTGADDWVFPLEDGLTGVVGTASFWVEVKGTVLSDARPGAERCFWEFRFLTGDEQLGESHFAPCVTEPTVVPEGLREITFAFDLPAASIQPGQDLRFELYTYDVGRSPGATVELLTGSIVHDSRVQVTGLRLPVGASLLTTTTE